MRAGDPLWAVPLGDRGGQAARRRVSLHDAQASVHPRKRELATDRTAPGTGAHRGPEWSRAGCRRRGHDGTWNQSPWTQPGLNRPFLSATSRSSGRWRGGRSGEGPISVPVADAGRNQLRPTLESRATVSRAEWGTVLPQPNACRRWARLLGMAVRGSSCPSNSSETYPRYPLCRSRPAMRG